MNRRLIWAACAAVVAACAGCVIHLVTIQLPADGARKAGRVATTMPVKSFTERVLEDLR